MDESQSRFMENIIGRSLPFCEAVLPLLRDCFPQWPADVTPQQLCLAVNTVRPSLLRLTADELTYPIHIMIRCELEQALFEGSLQVRELPGEWDRLYGEYLGVKVPDDRSGVLQDMHWAGGYIGYFPGYALGSAYGPQLLRRMEIDRPCLWQHVSRGDLSDVTGWLERHIHRYGSLMPPQLLLEQAFGGAFDPESYTDYLTEKYTRLYQL